MKALPLKENLKKYTRIENCPIRNVLSRFSSKWAMLILCVLSENEATRFNTISKAIPDISPKVLTETLRNLEADGLVKRKLYALMPITATKSKIQTHKSVPTTPLKILFLNSFFILSLPANQKGSGMIYTLAIISPYSSFSFLINSLTASTEGISCEQA